MIHLGSSNDKLTDQGLKLAWFGERHSPKRAVRRHDKNCALRKNDVKYVEDGSK